MNGYYDMADYAWVDGYQNPHTTITEVVPYLATFITHPTNSADKGWGYPFSTEDGAPLPMGTLEGPNQTKLLARREDKWAKANTPGNHVYGNIDWRGPVIRTLPDGQEERIILTWNGARMRYFTDNFYDWDADKAFEVYFHGKIVAVTLKPVLGAAAKLVDDVWHLFVICKDGAADVVYGYRMNVAGWSRGELIDEVIDSLRSAYEAETNPYGYVTLHRIPRQSKHGTPGHEIDEEAKEATTPWFFNESCTKAVCMREVDATYEDENGDEYTDESLSKYALSIGEISGSGFDFTYVGQLGRGTCSTTHEYSIYLDERYPGITYPRVWCAYSGIWPVSEDDDIECVDGEGLGLHAIARYYIIQDMIYENSQIIATDFDGDTQVTARVEVICDRSHREELNTGIDCNTDEMFAGGYHPIELCGHSPINTCPSPNGCETDGRPSGSSSPDDPPFFLDGSVIPWTGGQAKFILKFTNSGGDQEFTVYRELMGTEYENEHGVRKDPTDNKFEYRGVTKRFLHFLDLRHPYIASFTELDLDEFINVSVRRRGVQPDATIVTQYSQKERYVVASADPVDLTDVNILDASDTGRFLGYAFDGSPDTTVKVPDGGADWEYSKDVEYTHTEDGADRHRFVSEAHDISWEKFRERDADAATLEPTFEAWYGILIPNKWPTWNSFFDNTHYDEFLDVTVHLNYVNGGLARQGERWLLSYEEPKLAGENDPDDIGGSGKFHNILDGDDSIAILPGAEKLYPLSVF